MPTLPTTTTTTKSSSIGFSAHFRAQTAQFFTYLVSLVAALSINNLIQQGMGKLKLWKRILITFVLLGTALLVVTLVSLWTTSDDTEIETVTTTTPASSRSVPRTKPESSTERTPSKQQDDKKDKKKEGESHDVADTKLPIPTPKRGPAFKVSARPTPPSVSAKQVLERIRKRN